MTLLVGSCDP